ncbi:hypothetical protein PMI13_02251 [Chryseobacterium populi]|uniref:Uncharacterized protein n=1 Tax=Chryseobacterium populi TaxID=1144316 RepID=J3CHV4_9FLAO|nr:hypothetical protein PMI13_02251 [Chryseobacterium populi]
MLKRISEATIRKIVIFLFVFIFLGIAVKYSTTILRLIFNIVNNEI